MVVLQVGPKIDCNETDSFNSGYSRFSIFLLIQ
jgi:hypothetical protein